MGFDLDTYKKGFNDGLPIGISYIPASMACGIFANKLGVSIGHWTLMNNTWYTGSGAVAVLNLIAKGETDIIICVLALAVLTCRHVLYGVSIAQKFDKSVGIATRMIFAPINTDEIFAVSMQYPGMITSSYLFGICTVPYICWSIAGFLGCMFTQLLPVSIQSAFGITLYSIFLSLTIPPMIKSKPIVFSVVMASLIQLAFSYIPFLKSAISPGLVLLLCTFVTCTVAALLFPVKDASPEDTPTEELN